MQRQEHGGQALADLVLGRPRVDPEQVERGEEHARCAEAALKRVVLVKGLLERMERAVHHQALDGDELGAVGLDGEHQAGPGGLAIDEDGAGAADAVLAPDMGAGEAEVLAEKIHEACAARNGHARRPLTVSRMTGVAFTLSTMRAEGGGARPGATRSRWGDRPTRREGRCRE